jgi:hypothetical protein
VAGECWGVQAKMSSDKKNKARCLYFNQCD